MHTFNIEFANECVVIGLISQRIVESEDKNISRPICGDGDFWTIRRLQSFFSPFDIIVWSIRQPLSLV